MKHQQGPRFRDLIDDKLHVKFRSKSGVKKSTVFKVELHYGRQLLHFEKFGFVKSLWSKFLVLEIFEPCLVDWVGEGTSLQARYVLKCLLQSLILSALGIISSVHATDLPNQTVLRKNLVA